MEKHLSKIMLLIGTVVAVFGISLVNGFVWDDTYFFIGKKVYADFQLREIFLSLANGVEYLPLRDLTYAIDHQIWGTNPAGFHFTNLIIYLANVVVVFYLAQQLFLIMKSQAAPEEGAAAWFGLLAALLFAVHPVHSESVSFVTCRNVLVSGLFFFLSCYFYLRFLNEDKRKIFFYTAALLCFLSALLSKATTIILPLFLLLFSLLSKRNKEKASLSLAPFFSLSLLFYFFFKTVAIQSKVIDSHLVEDGNSFMQKIATAAEIPFFYLGKLILPVNLSVAYGSPFSTELTDFWAIASLVALLVIFLAGFARRRKDPIPLFVGALYLCALIPVLNFFSTSPIVADRYLYLASFPFALFLAYYLTMASSKSDSRWPIYASALLVVTWSGLSFARNLVWKDERSLWQQTVKTSPNSLDAYLGLVYSYYDAGDYRTTFRLLADMDRYKTDKDYYEFYRGLISYKNGDLAAAMVSWEKVLQKNDDFMAALSLLGHAYKQLGKYDKAMFYLNKALESPDLFFPSRKISAAEDRAAIIQILTPQLNTLRQRAIEKPSDLQARADLAIRLDTFGLYDEAIVDYLALEKISPANWQLSYNLGNVYKKLKRFKEASQCYEKSLSFSPDNVDILNNLATSYKELGDYKKAIELYKRAIAVDGRFALASFNLANTYLKAGDKQNALSQFKYTGERFPELKFKSDIAVENMQKL